MKIEEVNLSQIRPDRVQLLVDALRSGQFKQGYNRLAYKTYHYDDVTGVLQEGEDAEYCCLGVACEVAIANGAPVSAKWDAERMGIRRKTYGEMFRSAAQLPAAVAEWFGFVHASDNHPTGDPVLVSPLAVDVASVFNDSKRWDFEKIADLFEFTYVLQGHLEDGFTYNEIGVP